jgi:4-alpha-glucanotransferase
VPRLLIHYVTDATLSVAIRGERHEMTRDDDGWWSIELDGTGQPTAYGYVVHTSAGEVLDTDRTPRQLDGRVDIVDRWMGHDPATRSRRSALFTRARAGLYPEPSATRGRVTFRLLEPNLGPDATVVLVGGAGPLGNWGPDEGVELVPGPYPWWIGSVDLSGGDHEYKYVVRTADRSDWEQGPNRFVRIPDGGSVRVDDEGLMHHPGWSGAGVAIPVFSLRTGRSVGVGQFTDLVPFIDWAAAAGFSMVQLLPVNDTRKSDDWDDSYPYDPVSVRALHPLYADLEAIPGHEAVAADIEALRARFEPLPEVAYEDVMAEKMRILRAIHDGTGGAQPGLARFVEAERDWLGPYAAWQVLREVHGTPDMGQWGDDAVLDGERVDAMARGEHAERLAFHHWLQFQLHGQLGEVVQHARTRGVALKGDLPIGVSPASAEVWQHPAIFHLGGQAGAPPDDFAVRGQNWGFPTYDWEALAADDYAWWRHRFAAMADTMDAYRIDHVLGFFRIWEVPTHAIDGLLGHFRPCLPWSRSELREPLGEQSLDRLLRPTVDTTRLTARFGGHAEAVRARFFEGEETDLRFPAALATQRDIDAAFRSGALGELGEARLDVRRGLLDIAADVMLLEVEDGYHPRIEWDRTETYRRLEGPVRSAFDALAVDFMHHRHADLWEHRGRRALAAVVDATDMLACGEDLGMVPTEVPVVMHDLGLLTLEIERMPKRLGQRRADPQSAPYLSVVSPSTHDTSTLRMWWEEDPASAQEYWQQVLGRDTEAPGAATPELIEAILTRHLESPAMLCIAPLSDWLAIDGDLRRSDDEVASERINEPADRHHHWRYRMHLTVEDLHRARGFSAKLRSMLRAVGR